MCLANGGRGFAHPEVRDHQFAVLEELATQYPVEGVELDFAAAPGGSPFWLTPEDAPEYTPVMTDFVRNVAEMVRSRPGGARADWCTDISDLGVKQENRVGMSRLGFERD